ncbi:MAG: glycosyltransferase, partial [Planctomycetes bacterium]|nr:glycosyltransferase [Planctomycetota bacterium]
IGPVVREVRAALESAGMSHEVLVLDDASDDGTAAEAERAIGGAGRVVRRSGPRSLAAAVRDGFATARARCAVVMDADGSHPPEEVPSLVRAVLDGVVDISVGTRYMPGGGSDWDSPLRRWISLAGASLSRRVTGLADAGSGFFAVRRAGVPVSRLRDSGFKVLFDLLCIWEGEARVREVPYRFRRRRAGRSKFGLGVTLRFAVILLLVLRDPPSRRVRPQV